MLLGLRPQIINKACRLRHVRAVCCTPPTPWTAAVEPGTVESTKRDYGPIMVQFVLPGKPSGESLLLLRPAVSSLSFLHDSCQLAGPCVNTTPWCRITQQQRPPGCLAGRNLSRCASLAALPCSAPAALCPSARSLRPGCAVHEDPQGGEELRPLPLVPRRRPGQLLPDPPALRAPAWAGGLCLHLAGVNLALQKKQGGCACPHLLC